MEIRIASADFSSPVLGSGPRVATAQPIIFSRNVNTAAVGITGYKVGYVQGHDRPMGSIEIRVESITTANVVTVTATLGLRDWSGNWDDAYQGTIEFAVIAELQPATAPPPRADLRVIGMELNQVVQFFRSASFLDPGNALTDNSIYMVSGKNTEIRVYVDYDASAGLPPITNLTGSLVVRSPNNTIVLDPINTTGNPPRHVISPHRDSVTNMGVVDDTLNFMIPAIWCNGTVAVTCEVWDADSPGSTSPAFSRTIIFTDVTPLNLYIVGVDYNAVMPNLPAPTQAAFTSQALPGLVSLYPVGDIIQNGYTTIQVKKAVTGKASNGGCTGGFDDLVGRLSDMRGGSGDIYVGVLPANIVSAPGNQGGGCADSGVAAIFIDYGGLGDLP